MSFKNQLNLITIANNGFHKCSKLETISYEEKSNLRIIGIYSFSYCINLMSIKLPSQLKEISSYYNEECSKLKSIIILSNISKIGDFSFLNCSNLECIQYFGTDEPNVSQNAFQ